MLTTFQSMDARALAEKFGISMLVIFGSVARGDTRLTSDADVAYFSENYMSLMDEARLSTELSAILKKDVDLVNLKKSSPLLAYHVFKDGVAVYEKTSGFFNEFFIKSIRIYQESLPLFRAKMALL